MQVLENNRIKLQFLLNSNGIFIELCYNDYNYLDIHIIWHLVWDKYLSTTQRFLDSTYNVVNHGKKWQSLVDFKKLAVFLGPEFPILPKMHGLDELWKDEKYNGPCIFFETSGGESKHKEYRM